MADKCIKFSFQWIIQNPTWQHFDYLSFALTFLFDIWVESTIVQKQEVMGWNEMGMSHGGGLESGLRTADSGGSDLGAMSYVHVNVILKWWTLETIAVGAAQNALIYLNEWHFNKAL